MAYTKSEQFSETEIRLAKYGKALSHPARVAILKYLFENDGCMCGQIVEVLPLAQSTVSQHLAELKSSGLIKGDIDGAKVCYCINKQNWNEARAMIETLFNHNREMVAVFKIKT